ncbi:pentapeptide repeat-containing protein [Streptomyces sp. R21]|uniref:Pentapeptide repeat-containing protein n=1 Tax=Streptomyces sp. R21 TaxID=3238627 RepID=A0AB39P2M5_9ACTN
MLLVSLPGLAALAALLFTWMQVGQANNELRISEQGQITNRFNAAVRNLGSESMDVRLGGIYALERIMHDSARDHPTVVSVLSAYLRRHASGAAAGTSAGGALPADVDAVMNVLAGRSPEHDHGLSINLSHTHLRGWAPAFSRTRRGINLTGADLAGTDLSQAGLDYAQLDDVSLGEANLSGASLFRAQLRRAQLMANLRDASFLNADLTSASFCSGSARDQCADLTDVSFEGADLSEAALGQADLTKTTICPPAYGSFLIEGEGAKKQRCARLRGADLHGAKLAGLDLPGVDLSNAVLAKADLARVDLRKANLAGAELSHSDLSGARLSKANLTKANLTGAKLTGAKLDGARLDDVRGLPSSFRPPS